MVAPTDTQAPLAEQWDVVVIGAGPAGSSAAAVLAEHGRRVLVVEREPFPRYRVGESLIPFAWHALDRLGMVQRLDAAACTVKKFSVQFAGLDGTPPAPFYFQQHTDHDCGRTWQVVRSEFDRMMLENALAKGAQASMGTTARELIMDGEIVAGVRVTDTDGRRRELRARLVIDASGREVFSGNLLGWRTADPKLRKIAIWSYFRGGVRDPGVDEGATTVAYLPGKGWFWYIPLPDDIISVGAVAERDYLYRGPRDPQAILDREIALQPWIREHLAPARQAGPCRVTGDYSYRCRHCAADGLVLVGDAFAFLDPVFSSGVFLALHSGVMAGDAAHAAIAAGDCSAERFEAYGRRLCEAIEAMRRLVHAFYDTGFSFGAFLREFPELRHDLTDCLIGNVHKDLEPLFRAVARHAEVPAPLAYGGVRC